MIAEFLGSDYPYMNVVLPFVSEDWAAYIKSKRAKTIQPPLQKRLLPLSLRRRGGRFQIKRNQTQFAIALARGGHLNLLRWAFSQGLFHFNAQVCSAAAREGHLHILEWIHSLGPKHFRFDARTCGAAAASGRLDIVDWLITQCGCKYKVVFLRDAARAGHSHVLKWAMERDETFKDPAWKQTVLPAVVEGGHLSLIQELHSKFTQLVMESGGFLLSAAAMAGQRQVLEWLLGLSYDDYYWTRWTKRMCFHAARGGQLELLRDVLYPKFGTQEVLSALVSPAAKAGHLNVLIWLDSFGTLDYVWQLATYSKCGNWEMIKYAVEQLEKRNKRNEVASSCISSAAIRKGDLDMLEWMIDRGYTFDCDFANTFDIVKIHRGRVWEWTMEKFPSGNFSRYTFHRASSTGDLTLLAWLKEIGCPSDSEAYVSATWKGYLHVIEWLHKNGCRIKAEKMIRPAISCNRLGILQWLNKNNLLPGKIEGGKKYWPHGACSIEVLRWAQKNGFSLPSTMILNVALSGRLGILKWLKENAKGITWDKALWDRIYNSCYPHIISWGINESDCTWDKIAAQKRYEGDVFK